MGLLRDSRNATALSDGESVPSPKMPTLMMPWGLAWVAAARRRLPFSPLGDVAGGVQVFQRVCGGRLTAGVFVEPTLEPVPHHGLLEVPR